MIQTKETRPGTAGTVQDARKEVHNTTSDFTPSRASSQALLREKLFRLIDSAELGRYKLKWIETCAIIDRASRDLFEVAMMAFRYGFIKGQRAEKARQKTLRKREEARE